MIRFFGVVILVALTAAILAGMLRPVCVPISPKVALHMQVPFDDRTDRDLFVVKVYQRQGKNLFECKTWLTREVLE
jgi:hypothetical protein